MRDWLTYELSDLLLFSERVYWRLFELENGELWPMPLLASLAAAAALVVHNRRPGMGTRLFCGILALAWLSVGSNFVMQRYAPINWVMGYVGPVFMFQALVFAALVLRPAIKGAISRTALRLGYSLILAALAYPVLALLQGRGLSSAEVFGIAPDPTALASIGAAFLMTGHWYRLAALVLPCQWLLQSAVTLYLLNGPATLAPALGCAVSVVGIVALCWRPSGRST